MAADYYNFKMLCAYVNQVRDYLLLLRKELGEVTNVSYSPIDWFNKVNLNLYAKDPARDGNDPILSNMKNIAPYPGRSAFRMDWGGSSTFSVLQYSKDTGCKGPPSNPQKGGGLLDTLFKVVGVVSAGAFAVDMIAFMSIDQIFNAYRWYLLKYMRLAEIQSSPCVRHDYIMTTKLRTSGKLLRGRGAFSQLEDPLIQALRKARPSFPPYSYYLKEVEDMRTKKGGTRRRKAKGRKTRRHPF